MHPSVSIGSRERGRRPPIRSITHAQAVRSLTGVRAITLGVPRADLEQAIALTDRDRLASLVEVAGALACVRSR